MITHLGLVKTTLVDVPGRVAATVFTHGCPLACPYCHNARLQGGPVPEDFLPRREVMDFLSRRAGMLEAVCITGGEPMVHGDLPRLLHDLRDLGFFVKLDTSGVFPDRLRAVLEAELVDMVAMDLKTAPEHYHRLGGIGAEGGAAVLESLELLRLFKVEYELRTTLAPGVVEESDLQVLSGLLRGNERWTWAQFKPPSSAENPQPQPVPYPVSTLQEWHARYGNHPAKVSLRGA